VPGVWGVLAGTSVIRNPTLARVLSELGYIEVGNRIAEGDG